MSRGYDPPYKPFFCDFAANTSVKWNKNLSFRWRICCSFSGNACHASREFLLSYSVWWTNRLGRYIVTQNCRGYMRLVKVFRYSTLTPWLLKRLTLGHRLRCMCWESTAILTESWPESSHSKSSVGCVCFCSLPSSRKWKTWMPESNSEDNQLITQWVNRLSAGTYQSIFPEGGGAKIV